MLQDKPMAPGSELPAKTGTLAQQSPAAKPAFRLGYQPALNGLRGVAILMVLLAPPTNSLPGCLGFVGVDIFFVLSGFLITSLLLEEWEESGRISLRAFYMRRALRLLPALGVMLAAFVVYGACAHLPWQFRRDIAEVRATAFYYVNWDLGLGWMTGIYLRHAWSLSIEEQFYLLWPPLLLLLLRCCHRRSILNFILLGVFCSCGWRWLSLAIADGEVNTFRMQYGLDTRADALLIGCATAVILSSDFIPQWNSTKRMLQISLIISLIGLAMMGLTFDVSQIWMYRIGWLLISLLAAVVIIALMMEAAGWARRFLEARWLVYLGVISYPLYLWHFPIMMILDKDRKLPRSSILLWGACLTLVTTLGSYYLVEQPCLRLKKRFRKIKK